jgi:hypothetical protein
MTMKKTRFALSLQCCKTSAPKIASANAEPVNKIKNGSAADGILIDSILRQTVAAAIKQQ